MSLPTLEPIRDEDVPEFCRFLPKHLSRERSAEQWGEAFKQDWCPGKPNNGFLIRHAGRIVGGIGAIYAERSIRGRLERFCNITSWCVLDDFRSPRLERPVHPIISESSVAVSRPGVPCSRRETVLFDVKRKCCASWCCR